MAYTVFNTIVLGIVLIVLSYVIYIMFDRLNIKIDKKIVLSLSLWVLLSAFVRVFEDAKIYPEHFFTVTPGIILLFTMIFIPVFLLGYWLDKKKKFALWKTMTASALIGIAVHTPFYKAVNLEGGAIILVITAIWMGVFAAAQKIVRFDWLIFGAILTHMFDAAATYVSLSRYGYTELHVLPTFLINLTGPWIMFVLKLAIIVPVVFIIDRYSEKKELRNFLLTVVLVLGLAPALRDLLRLVMAV